MLHEANLPFYFSSFDQLTQCDVLHLLMSWGRLATSNGGRIHEHAIKRVVVGLIPLKLHPECFWKKGNLIKIKRNNLKWYISSYLCPKIDLPGLSEAMSNPPPLWNSWAFDSLPLHPSGISNFLRGGSLDILWNHTMKESPHLLFLWIRYFFKYNYTVLV